MEKTFLKLNATVVQHKLICTIWLDDKMMLDMLNVGNLIIDERYYSIPRQELLQLLICKCYGQTTLELIEIKKPL